MGQTVCGDPGKIPESKKFLNFFKKIKLENNFDFSINNYDNTCNQVEKLSKNTFEKFGEMHQLRIDFIQALREELNMTSDNYITSNNIVYGNKFNYNNYIENINNINFYNNESERILYYIIIMTSILKNYLKRNNISFELNKSLLDLSIIISKKNYNKNNLKLVLYYLSRMFEILFVNFHNIQNFVNINDYLTKIGSITNDYNILTKEEKYPFIITHIISLGELFHNDFNNIFIDSENQTLLMKFYTYLIIKNYDFIIKNHSTYKNILKNKKNNNFIDYTNSKYDKNDLIENDLLSENIMKKSKEYDDLTKINHSNLYFLIICFQDTFTGKNIFYEFDKQFDLEIKENNLENEIHLNKFKEACFLMLFSEVKPSTSCSTILLSIFEYFLNNELFENKDSDIFYDTIILLYDNFNNNKMFIDKYSSILSRIFTLELENNKKDNFIIDRLYNYILNLNKNIYHINSEDSNENRMNKENLYLFINLIRYISFYYKTNKNIKIAHAILIYFTNFMEKIRIFLKKPTNYINNIINELQIQQNFFVTLNNFDYNKDDYFTSLNESIQFLLSNFLSSYIIFINDFFKIKINQIANKFDFSIITTITYLEISFIKNNNKKNIKIIIKLINIYISILNKTELIDYEGINDDLNNNLKLIIKETRLPNINLNIYNYYIKYNTFHLKLIYSVIMIILIEIHKKNSTLPELIEKHNKIIETINQYNNFLYSHCFPKFGNIQSFNHNNIIYQLTKSEKFIIEKNIFQHIINIIKKILFNDDEDDDSQFSFNLYRTRSIYKKDKKNDIYININTNKNDGFLNNLPMLFDDSISNYSNNYNSNYYSNNSNIFNGSYINMPQNTLYQNLNLNVNKSLFSERIILPYKDNNTTNFPEPNRTLDIISDKGSSHFDLKV